MTTRERAIGVWARWMGYPEPVEAEEFERFATGRDRALVAEIEVALDADAVEAVAAERMRINRVLCGRCAAGRPLDPADPDRHRWIDDAGDESWTLCGARHIRARGEGGR